MNTNELLWSSISERSLVAMISHVPEWGALASTELLCRTPSFEILVDALRALTTCEWGKPFVPRFEKLAVASALELSQVRWLMTVEGLNETVYLELRRRRCGVGATIEELISLTNDPEPEWRHKAVEQVLQRDLTYKHWEQLFQCWGDKRHVDIAPRLWGFFRAKYPMLDLDQLFDIASTCPHVVSAVVEHYLALEPKEIADTADHAHNLDGAANMVERQGNGTFFQAGLIVHEQLNKFQQERVFKKAKQFRAYARELEQQQRFDGKLQ